MKELIFTLPAVEFESFKKFTSKMQKYIPELNVEYGKLYNKIFSHAVRIDGVDCKPDRVWHEVIDVKVMMPAINEWQLLVTFKDGCMFVADFTKKLVLRNPSHGANYNKCDVCGHWCKNSYVVYNTNTGEELQVGCECAKKFGLNSIEFVYQFTKELYRMYNSYCSFKDDEIYPSWRGPSDPRAFSSVETTTLLKAAKAYYNGNPAWVKGYYRGKLYIPSESNIAIQANIEERVCDGTDEYVTNVCDYIKSLPTESEFAQEMFSVANSFYARPANASHAYFMIKFYEEHLERQRLNLMQLSEGMQVKIEGEIIATNTFESYFGMAVTYRIKTNKGYIVERTGVIPVVKNGNKETTSFFALVKFANANKIVLDRALKNPKKGKEIVCL